MIYKCKICGGSLNIKESETICTCEYCGTTQTIPHITSEKKARLFNRANEYRMSNEFDKAYNAFEAIANDDPTEAEAYWGLVLSQYGVEYIDDERTAKKIPTCHRTRVESVQSNSNYLKAIEFADVENRMIYEDEAQELDSLQKRILSVSSKEEKYDVFICYKELAENNERTDDSVVAQDIYNALTKEGYKVFFSRISLEDKIGKDYEPYIFNALSTSKVLLLVTTKNEYCNAVWVKNEWKRFLDFMNHDNNKTLIPVVKNMSVYELPDELQKFQVQDYSKIGAQQDLLHGISKILGNSGNNGFNADERNLLNTLNEKERKSTLTRRILISVALLFIGAFFGYAIVYEYSNDSLYRIILKNYEKIAILILFVSGLLFYAAIELNIFKGFNNKVACILHLLSLSLFSFALICVSYVGITISSTIMLIIVLAILFSALLLSVFSLAFTFKNNRKKIAISALFATSLFMLALVVCLSPVGVKLGNSNEQILINTNYIDVLSEPNGKLKARVYKNQVFDVIEIKDLYGKQYYKIKVRKPIGAIGYITCLTSSNKNEAIYIDLNEKNGTNLFVVNNEYINVRKEANTKSEIIGQVFMGEVYEYKKKIKDKWYSISYNGTIGYIYGGDGYVSILK